MADALDPETSKNPGLRKETLRPEGGAPWFARDYGFTRRIGPACRFHGGLFPNSLHHNP